MNKYFGIVLMALAVFVSTALGFLYFDVYRSNDNSSVLKNMESIFELQQIDSAWSLATIQTLSTTNSDFDSVAAFLPRFRELRNQLSNSELIDTQTPAPLKNKLLIFLSLLEGKETAIEHFKSNLAITRNSIKYLPLAAKTLSEKAHEMTDKELAVRIQKLNQQTSNYLAAPSTSLMTQVLNDLSDLESDLMELPPEIVNPLGNFISHAQVLIENKVPMDEIVKRVTNNKAVKVGSELVTLYKSYNERISSERSDQIAQQYLLILVGTVFLALTALAAGTYTFFSATRYKKQLESQVQARTEELERKANAATNSIVGEHHGQSMKTTSDMAASMAHEINTPLGYIAGNLEFLLSGTEHINLLMSEFGNLNSILDEPEAELMRSRVRTFIETATTTRQQSLLDEFPGIVKDISDGVAQIQKVIQELNNFTRKDRLEKEWFDLGGCIEDSLKMVKHQLSDDIRIVKKMGDIPQLYGSQSDMNQVLINLINNASLAIVEAGRSPGIIKLTTLVVKGYVVLDIQDNGIGMNEKVKAKIFDPFFTTREVGKGTGLGLSIVQKIVTQNQGKVMIKSIPGKGTQLRVAIPVSNYVAQG